MSKVNCTTQVVVNQEEIVEDQEREYTLDELSEPVTLADLSEEEYHFRERFHDFTKEGKPKAVFDHIVFRYITTQRYMLVVKGELYIYEDGLYVHDESQRKLKSMLKKIIYPELIKDSVLSRIVKLFLSAVELNVEPDDLEAYPREWIHLKNGLYDPVCREMHPHDPKYKSVCQMQFEYDPNASLDGHEMEQYLNFAIPNDEDREMMLQYFGYCLSHDTRQQKFLMLNGPGGTGKSILLNLLQAMIGADYISNVPLQELPERFSAHQLVGKMVNVCADLDSQALKKPAALKIIVGEDTSNINRKHKKGFSTKLFTRLIFSANDLPPVQDENSDAFYRRLMILKLTNKPKVVDTGLLGKLKKELPYLVQLSIKAAERMYDSGKIFESEASKQAVEEYRYECDTVSAFVLERCEAGVNLSIPRTDLYQAYQAYCWEEEKIQKSRQDFYKSLRAKGVAEKKSNGVRFFVGLALQKY